MDNDPSTVATSETADEKLNKKLTAIDKN